MNHSDAYKLAILTLGVILVLSSCSSPVAIPSTTTPTSIVPAATDTSLPATATPTSKPPVSTEDFPIGVMLGCPNCGANLEGFTEIYNDDGTMIVYKRGVEELRGKWYLEGDIYRHGDTWCNDEETMPASYKWRFDGKFLTMQLIDDYCTDRIGSMKGKPWRVIDASSIPTGTYTAKKGDLIIEIFDDNRFSFSKKNGDYNTSGTFSASVNEVTWQTDEYCDQENSGPATYSWYFENDVLSFDSIGKDNCAARHAFLIFAYHKEQ